MREPQFRRFLMRQIHHPQASRGPANHATKNDSETKSENTSDYTPENPSQDPSQAALRRFILSQHAKAAQDAPTKEAKRAVRNAKALEQTLRWNGSGFQRASRPDPEHLSLRRVDLSGSRPARPLMDRLPASYWIRNQAMPWLQLGDTLLIAFADAETAEICRHKLEAVFGPFVPVLAPQSQITHHLWLYFRFRLAQQANFSLPNLLSARSLLKHPESLLHYLPLSTLACLAIIYPRVLFTAFCLLAASLLGLFTLLKLAGVSAWLRGPSRPRASPLSQEDHASLPVISVLVPLYQEAEISQALLRRILRLTYPKQRCEVLLVLEEGDQTTQSALAEIQLPDWVRVIEVPEWGDLRTKPRAMNYALNFCRGEIIGVWDAEDSPQSDQLEQVAASFARAKPDVACLQGVLDYYNPRVNWISRCFTLEYASWFRIILPGIARLRLVVPLGGTTMFVRRRVLEDLGGWDAHNVTEDADLGVRLCRMGYRTEMLACVTYEEASCSVATWTRQRSRWLKGFMSTYLVHMRDPRQLWHQLGARRFLGFQAFFLGTTGQFLMAPFLWSFWLVFLGFEHPSEPLLGAGGVTLAAVSLVFFELLGVAIAIAAAFAAGRPGLAIWSPCLSFYFAMGAAASYKALYELFVRPSFWDKTSHGLHAPEVPMPPAAPEPRPGQPSTL